MEITMILFRKQGTLIYYGKTKELWKKTIVNYILLKYLFAREHISLFSEKL